MKKKKNNEVSHGAGHCGSHALGHEISHGDSHEVSHLVRHGDSHEVSHEVGHGVSHLVRRSALGSSQLAKVTFLNILKVFWDPVFVGQMSGTMSATTMSSRRWKSGSVTYELSDGRTGVGARDACVSNLVVSKFSSCTTTTSVRYRAARAAVPEPSNLLFPMGRLALVLL